MSKAKATRATTKRKPAGTPTALNLWVLCRLFGAASEIPNQIEAPSVPHIRRCLKAGLITATRSTLTLTDAGREACTACGVLDEDGADEC
jgi:hypothetical protein